MTISYANFDLRVTRNREVYSRSQETEAGPEHFDLDYNQIGLSLELIQLEQTDPRLIRSLGETLYLALFPQSILVHLVSTRQATDSLRLRLRFEDPKLADFPWEMLHDGEKFLGLDAHTSIVRYTEVRKPLETLSVNGPLRLLVVAPSPVNYPDFDCKGEVEALKAILSNAQTEGSLEVEFLPHATRRGLLQHLRSSEFHILHFLGYSGIDSRTGHAALLFEQDNGSVRRISADELGTILFQEDLGRIGGKARSLRLVMINDIEISSKATKSYSVDTAMTLIHSGIPAAVAMRDSLPSPVLRAFAGEFYGAIVSGLPIDYSLVLGRMAIRSETAPTGEETQRDKAVAGEWSSPVLLLHAEDGRLFDRHRAQQLSFAASSVGVFAEIEQFQVETRESITRYVLNHPFRFIFLGIAGLLMYTLSFRAVDLLFVSGVAVVFGAVWLLSSLYRKSLPNTLDRLWRYRILTFSSTGDLAKKYLAFLNEYNALLNQPRYSWIAGLTFLAVGLFVAYDFKPVVEGPQLWDRLVRLYIWVFEPLAGFVLGTLLWKMVATVIMTTRLSYNFELDIRPTHPDTCGGLKPLGDLYFEHARIILLPGVFIAVWIVLLSLANVIMERHVQTNYPDQAALINTYQEAYAACDQTKYTDGSQYFSRDVCLCLAEEPETTLQAPRQKTLRCIEKVHKTSQTLLVAAAWTCLEFYRWLLAFSVLLAILAAIAIFTFFVPMYNTNRIMRTKATYFRRKAYSLAGEIAELERQIEQYGTISIEDSLQVRRRLEWLHNRYQKYANPPTWPFDARVGRRMLGFLATMLFSWLLSEALPHLIPILRQ